ncbi:tripartite tricarboxylate transporter TctB family protein [Clostridium sp.]
MDSKSKDNSDIKSKIKMDFDALVGIVVALGGVIYLIASYNIPRSTIGKPLSPSYFPFLLGGILVVLGILLFFRSDLEKTKQSIKEMKNMSEKEKSNSKLIVITTVACIVYGIIFNTFGFVISTFIFIEFMLYLTNKKEMLKNTIVSICFSIVIYILFSTFLGIILPPLPFLNI